MKISQINLLNLPEQEKIKNWSKGKPLSISAKTITQLFEEQVFNDSTAIALVVENQVISYGDLNKKVNQIAHFLLNKGVKAGDIVALCGKYSCELIAGLLAILKTGATYLPLDHMQPLARLKLILEDSHPVGMITIGMQLNQLMKNAFWSFDISEQAEEWQGQSEHNLNQDISPESIAYIIYTSGSTGTPKGVCIKHQSLTNFISGISDTLKITSKDRSLGLTTLAFDIAGLEIYAPLVNGALLIIPPIDVKTDIKRLVDFIHLHSPSIMQATPATWQMLINAGWQGNSNLNALCGGDILPLALVKELQERSHSLWHFYGPTEATIWATGCKLDKEQTHIGKPLPNTYVYILNEQLKLCPIGIIGELYIGGLGIAQGYLNQPQLTDEYFIPNPFNQNGQDRLYKTGDLARYLPDGNIEFLGRRDSQIKLRGYRIELGEIETVLQKHPFIKQSIVLLAGKENEQELIAYCCCQPAFIDLESKLSETFYNYLLDQLPAYMIPNKFIILEKFPLTFNGKIDRKALLNHKEMTSQLETHQYPRTELEQLLVNLWKKVLKRENISIYDNFFHLGGHSLLAMRLVMELDNNYQIKLSMREFFAMPTIAEIAKNYEYQAKKTIEQLPQILPIDTSTDRHPLSFAQRRLWFLQQAVDKPGLYSIGLAWQLHGELNISALQKALNKLVERHESLRTIIIEENHQPLQKILANNNFNLEKIDLNKKQASYNQYLQSFFMQEFSERATSLMKGIVYSIKKDIHIFSLVFHHLIVDGWSIGILIKELSNLYNCYAKNQEPNMPSTLQYKDYVYWQNNWLQSDNIKQQIIYWQQKFADAETVLALPTDKLRPTELSYQAGIYEVQLDATMVKRLRALGEAQQTTLFVVLLAVWKLLLHRYSGQTDIIIGTPIANRHYKGSENSVGLFINTLALYTKCTGNLEFATFLQQVKETVLAAYEHQDIPFEQLLEHLKVERLWNRHPLFQIMMVFQPLAEEQLQLIDLAVTDITPKTALAKFDITLWVQERPNDILNLQFEYADDLFEQSTIIRMAEYFQHLIEQVLNNRKLRISEILLQTISEKELLKTWSYGETLLIPSKSISAVFEEQVEKNPTSVAIKYENITITYSELNKQANRLANHLHSVGIKNGDKIGIYGERSPELLYAILATLKAGATYIPLEIDYPIDRLKFILSDSRPAGVIVIGADKEKLQEFEGWVLDLNEQLNNWQSQPAHNLANRTFAEDIAYIIYTSGSTGKPKGVMVSHYNVLYYVTWFSQAFAITVKDSFDFSSTIAFDFSITTTLVPLLAGAKIAIYQPNKQLTVKEYLKHLMDHEISIVKYTPSYLQLLNDYVSEIKNLSKLKYIILGGEALQKKSILFLSNIPQLNIVNEYGPTETTVAASYFKFTSHNIASLPTNIPIGKPAANTLIYLLDEYHLPCSIGRVGEIYIGGAGVTAGYLNQPLLETQSFMTLYINNQKVYLYRTGDLARYLPDGNIEYLERKDTQIKLLGHRIEPAEIERILIEVKKIKQVAFLNNPESDVQQLIAFIVPDQQINETSFRQHIKKLLLEKLPYYMVPSAIIFLQCLPINTNGKIDKNALLKSYNNYHSKIFVEHTDNDWVDKISALWLELLNVPEINTHHNFFDIGGNSLLLLLMRSRLEKLSNYKVSIAELFGHPTVAALASFIQQKANQSAKIHHVDKKLILDQSASEDIAIIGIACRFPGAENVQAYWENLCAGRETIQFFTDDELISAGHDPELIKQKSYIKAKGALENIENFDYNFFGFSQRDAETLDPQQRIFLELTWEALEDAGQPLLNNDNRIGIYAGANSVPMYLINHLLPNARLVDIVGIQQLTLNNLNDLLATRISYKLNLKGPSITLQTACSTSLVAVCAASQSLIRNECEVALAGGISLTLPSKAGYVYEPGMINSPDGHCRVFDEQAAGTVHADGGGVIVLKKLSAALRDKDNIYAVIKGYGINNDGADKVGFTAPSVSGQVAVIEQALKMAGISSNQISYLEAHGTGTTLGDPIEMGALRQVFSNKINSKCALGAVKSNIGHTNIAAGIAGLIKTVLCLYHKKLVPSLHFQKANAELLLEESNFYVNTELKNWETMSGYRYAGVSAFGIGGTNAHVVLQESTKELQTSITEQNYHIIPLSAKTQAALTTQQQNLVGYLQENQDLPIDQVAYTYQYGRAEFDYRSIVVSDTAANTILQLSEESTASSRYHYQSSKKSLTRVIFLFPGQGSQYRLMGKELYRQAPLFKEQVDHCAQILINHVSFDIRQILFNFDNTHVDLSLIEQTEFAQPALFVIEYALAKLWLAFGIKPDLMLGHSLGEYVAACLAGVFNLEDALYLVAMRGKLAQKLPSGKMLAIQGDVNNCKHLFDPTKISLAAINSPNQFVVSGREEDIKELENACYNNNLATRYLQASHAFHSHLLEPILEEFAEIISKVKLNSPHSLFLSNLTGKLVDEMNVTKVTYWVEHLRRTVLFGTALENISDDKNNIFVEIGPGQMLSSLVKKMKKSAFTITSLPMASVQSSEYIWLLFSLGKAWCEGVSVNWLPLHDNQPKKKLSLPTYPFVKERCWINKPQSSELTIKNPERISSIERWFYIPSWQLKLLPELIKSSSRKIEKISCYLIFADNHSFSRNLAEELIVRNHLVIEVFHSENFKQYSETHYAINKFEQEDYKKLFQLLASQKIKLNYVLHYWSIDSYQSMSTEICTDFIQQQFLGFYSVIFIVKAMLAVGINNACSLKIITNRACNIMLEEQQLNIAGTPLISFSRILNQELPQFSCQLIDINCQFSSDIENELLHHSAIVKELTSNSTDEIVAYRGKQRWAESFAPIHIDLHNHISSLIKEGGVYLITGGLGHMGLAIAKYLAQRVNNIKLILITRTDLPSREEWHALLAVKSKEDELVQRIHNIKEIEALGAEIIIAKANVEELTQLESVITNTYAKFNNINGVIHASGLPVRTHDQHIALLNINDCEAHFYAKVIGLMNLHQLLKTKQPDFWFVMSSLANNLGGLGLAAYAAANAAMEAFCTQQMQTKSSLWFCVNWDNWIFEDDAQQGSAIAADNGLTIFNSLLNYHFYSPVITSVTDLSTRISQWENIKNNHTTLISEKAELSKKELITTAIKENSIGDIIYTIWQEHLGNLPEDNSANFFELGGDSLLAVRLASRLSTEFHVTIFPHELLQNLTVESQVKLIKQKKSIDLNSLFSNDLSCNNLNDKINRFPLSFAQKRLWFFEQLHPNTSWFNMPFAYTIEGKLNVDALNRAFIALINRHVNFRTAIHQLGEESVQIISSQVEFSVSEEDLTDLQAAQKNAYLRARLKNQLDTPFDLAKPPLLRAELYKINDNNYVLFICLHHIISDGWSMELFFNDLAFYYQKYKDHLSNELPELSYQYPQFALWQQEMFKSNYLQQQLTYWKEQLADIPPLLNLPLDNIRSKHFNYEGASYRVELDKLTLEALKSIASSYQTTLFTVLLTTYQAFLHRICGQEIIVVGTPTANRHYPKVDSMMGFFVNTLALKANCTNNPSFSTLLRQVKETVIASFKNQDVYFDQVVDVLGISRDLTHDPIFQTVFTVQKAGEFNLELADLCCREVDDADMTEQRMARTDLYLIAKESDQNLILTFEYSKLLFQHSTIVRLMANYVQLVSDIIRNPNNKIGNLQLLTDKDMQITLQNNVRLTTLASIPCNWLTLFEKHVESMPDAIALCYENNSLTYQELDIAADQLASHLKRFSLSRNRIVPILIESSFDRFIAILGVFKANLAFVPIDVDCPTERFSFILKDVDAAIVITKKAFLNRLSSFDLQAICIDTDLAKTQPFEIESNHEALSNSDQIAYLIYTSGSTGRPKGVLITHNGLTNLAQEQIEFFQINAESRLLQFAPISFDAAVSEWSTALAAGATLYLIPEAKRNNFDFILTYIKYHQITVLTLPPSVLINLGKSDLPFVKTLISAGERCQNSIINEFASSTRLINAYGPTEATVCATMMLCDKQHSAATIGYPINNLEIYILDKYLQIVPIGIVGELYIGGIGLAQGYLNQPELTKEQFIPHPFNRISKTRLYKTGDLARYLPDGMIEYIGRIDDQIKLRGYRIELGEVEQLLRDQPLIQEAVVVLKNQGQQKQLVAYLVGNEVVTEAEQITAEEQLRLTLEQFLPRYMLPHYYIWLAELPLTANGKVDKQALAKKELLGNETKLIDNSEQPTAVEAVLLQIWTELLGVNSLSIYDNFFAVGGDSIISIQVVARARQAGLQLSVKQLFETPTIAQLANINNILSQKPELTINKKQTFSLPLTPIQHWFFSQNLEKLSHWNQAVLLKTQKRLTKDKVELTVKFLIQRYIALRLRFKKVEDQWQQLNSDNNTFICEVVDLNSFTVEQQKNQMNNAIMLAQSSLNISTGPLYKIILFNHQSMQHLLLIFHHLVIDAVSWRIFLAEFGQIYNSLEQSSELKLPALLADFDDWALALQHYAESDKLKQEKPFWLNVIRHADIGLPPDFEASINTFESAKTITVILDADKTQRLVQEVPKAYKTHINDILLAALAETIYQETNKQDIYFDLEGHGREQISSDIDVTQAIGWFTTVYPVYLNIHGQSTIIERLKAIKEQLHAIPNKGLGYGVLRYLAKDIELVSPVESAIGFNYLGQWDNSQRQGFFHIISEGVEGSISEKNTRPHLIEINAAIINGELEINWTYSTKHYQEKTIQRFTKSYKSQLHKLIKECTNGKFGYTPLDFPLISLSQGELNFIASNYNKIEDIYPLSPLQSGLLYRALHDDLNHINSAYFIQSIWQINGDLDISCFKLAWQQAVDKNTILRSGFRWDISGKPLQFVYEKATLPFFYHDLRNLSESEKNERIQKIILADKNIRFNLDNPPLLRIGILHVSDTTYQMLFTHNHIILDGWSGGILFNQIIENYINNIRKSVINRSSSPHLPYKNYIAWLSKKDLNEAKCYWKDYLSDLSIDQKLSALISSISNSQERKRYEEYSISINARYTQIIKELAKRLKVTINAILQTAWSILLYKYLNKADIIFGITVSGRSIDLPKIEQMLGIFINTLPLRIKVQQESTVEAMIAHVQEINVKIQEYSYVPLSEIQTYADVENHMDLVDHLFVFENYPARTREFENEARLAFKHLATFENTEYPLTLIVSCHDEVNICFSYNADQVESSFIKNIALHYQQILKNFESYLSLKIKDINILTLSENQKLAEIAHTISSNPFESLNIPFIFEQQVLRNPKKTAICYQDRVLTYGALNKKSNQLARYLLARNIKIETVIAIAISNPISIVTTMLGILKAGGVYLPLDIDSPPEYLIKTLDAAGKPLLITDDISCSIFISYDNQFNLDREIQAIEKHDVGDVNQKINCTNLAYILYTSGTTGTPKGVMIEHKNIIRLIYNPNYIDITDKDVIAQSASIAFDASTFEIWGALINGAKLVCIGKEVLLSPTLLKETIQNKNISIMWLTAGLFNQLVSIDPTIVKGLDHLIVGGEALDPVIVNKLIANKFIGSCQLLNGYGPTEATTFATTYQIQKEILNERIPIGKPINATAIYILNNDLKPVPNGAIGEICIAGHGLARGYFQDEFLTAEKFIQITLPNSESIRIYRTGDIGRLLPDGNIEFWGRADKQVKIRGYRVELTMVEAAIKTYPLVKQAVVIPKANFDNNMQLIAYIILIDQMTAAEKFIEKLNTYLLNKLPSYMLPHAIMILDKFPLTNNGKINAMALPMPSKILNYKLKSVFPQTLVEVKLALIWESLLKIKKVGICDSFFELGGNSLLAVKLIHEIEKEFHVRISIHQLFQNKTIAGLALLLEDKRTLDDLLHQDYFFHLQQVENSKCLIFIHPGDGLSSCYQSLLSYLPTYSLYAFNNPYYGRKDYSFLSIEEMAACYVKRLLASNLSGPYYLAGWSFGGAVAFEMAQQLKLLGKEVAKVIMIDTYNFSNYKQSLSDLLTVNLRRLQEQQISNIISTDAAACIQLELERNITILIKYLPKLYLGEVILLKAVNQKPSLDVNYDDFYNGWREVVSNIQVKLINGAHSELLSEPIVRYTANALSAIIEIDQELGEAQI